MRRDLRPALDTLRGVAMRAGITIRARQGRRRLEGEQGVLRLPLSALREHLAGASADAHWTVDPGGASGRALVQPAGSNVTFSLRLAAGLVLRGRIRLVPVEWRDGSGSIRGLVTVTDARGKQRKLWTGQLAPVDAGGDPDGLEFSCWLPAGTTALVLSVERPPAQTPTAVSRVLWLDCELSDPTAAAGAVTVANATQTVADADRGPASSVPSEEPLISVLTPVHDPPAEMLEEAIRSVLAQTFTNWELCLVDDGSRNPEILTALNRHAADDPRIRVLRRAQAGGIAVATNAALSLATGTYVALLDHDDTLEPTALQLVAEAIAEDRSVDMIYTDEAVMEAGSRVAWHHKPAWSPEHMAALMYTCHLGVYRHEIALEIGGFRTEFDGSQDYDFVLRFAEHSKQIAHVPVITYNWRSHPNSTAALGGNAKPYAYVAGQRVISAHLNRCGVDAEVKFGNTLGMYRVVHRVDPSVSVSLTLSVGDASGLEAAATSWLRQPHANWEVILEAPARQHASCRAALERAGVPRGRFTLVAAGADRATGLDTAARAARSDQLVLMQMPVVGLTHDWLRRLLGYSSQPDVGAVGPLVLSPDGRIIEAGIALPDGIPLHLCYGLDAAAGSPVVSNLSAVSGVVAMPRESFQQLGGLRPEWGELSLIDLCLRLTDAGRRIVCVPDARLQAASADHVVNDLPTLWALRRAWLRSHGAERYYSRHYRADRGDFRSRRTA